MSERWNVTFMKDTEQVGDMQTVEADDEKQARFVAQHMYPELDAKSNGMLIMEEHHDLSPTDSLRHIGNVWDELREIQMYPNLTPRWADMAPSAQAAFTFYLREYCPLQQIVETVVEINGTYGRMN